MENKMIENIYYNILNTDEYNESYETKRTEKEVVSQLDEIEKIVGKETYFEIEGIISSTENACERNGFIIGFKHAMRLAAECGIVTRSVTA